MYVTSEEEEGQDPLLLTGKISLPMEETRNIYADMLVEVIMSQSATKAMQLVTQKVKFNFVQRNVCYTKLNTDTAFILCTSILHQNYIWFVPLVHLLCR